MTAPTESEIRAVRVGCEAAGVYLVCDYPKCGCTSMPDAVRAVLAMKDEPAEADAIQLAISLWNFRAATNKWPAVKTPTQPRRRAMGARLKECGGLDGWRAILERIERTPWLRHQTFLCFDWVTKSANFQKIVDGNYDDRKPGANGAAAKQAFNL